MGQFGSRQGASGYGGSMGGGVMGARMPPYMQQPPHIQPQPHWQPSVRYFQPPQRERGGPWLPPQPQQYQPPPDALLSMQRQMQEHADNSLRTLAEQLQRSIARAELRQENSNEKMQANFESQMALFTQNMTEMDKKLEVQKENAKSMVERAFAAPEPENLNKEGIQGSARAKLSFATDTPQPIHARTPQIGEVTPQVS